MSFEKNSAESMKSYDCDSKTVANDGEIAVDLFEIVNDEN